MGLPIVGTLVVLSINPIATLESLIDDDELLAACKEMENRKYVAYVGESLQFFNPFVPYRSYDFYFIFQGLPSEDDLADGQEVGMTIPLLPNTKHPSGRVPINVTLPLPWDDCYISIFCSVEARAPTEVAPDMPKWLLPTLEVVRVRSLLHDDRARRLQLYDLKYPGQEAPGLHPSTPWPDEDDTESCSGSDSDSDDSDSDALESEINSVQEITEEFLAAIPSDTMPVIVTDYELGALDKPGDPKDFFKEVEYLNKLVVDYKVRKSLQIERQIEEARLRDDEHFADLLKPAAIPDSSQPLEAPHINSLDDATKQPKHGDAEPHPANSHVYDHDSPPSLLDPSGAMVESTSVGADLTSNKSSQADSDEERQRDHSHLPVVEKAVAIPVEPAQPSVEPVSPLHEEKQIPVSTSPGTHPTSNNPPQVDEEGQRDDTTSRPLVEEAVAISVELSQPSEEPVGPVHGEKQIPKRSPIIRLWGKSKRVVKTLVPRKLGATLSTFRQKGIQRLDRTFGRFKGRRRSTNVANFSESA